MVCKKMIVLPSTDPGFLSAIDDVALIASGLIGSVEAAMLAIALPRGRWNDTPLVTWNHRLVGAPLLARTLIDLPMFALAFEALCRAADALFARLAAWRWADIDAPGLCLVTDGVGVVLSLERPPFDADCGWLLALAQPESGATTLRTPRPNDAWSLIAVESGTFH